MIIEMVITLTALAWTTSVLTFGFGVAAPTTRPDIQRMIDVVGGLASAFTWWFAALGATAIETHHSGVTVVNPSPGAALLFAVFGVLMFIVAIYGTAALLNVLDVEREGVEAGL